MTLIQYLLALALRAFICVVGLVIAGYFGVQVVGSLFVLGRIMPRLEETDSAPPLLWLLQHFGTNGGLMLVGIGTVWFAVRAIIARIERGIPKDDEVVGKSAGGRLFNGLIYGAGFLWGTFSLAVTVLPGTEKSLLIMNGTTVEARVLAFEATPDPKVWLMRYEFRTPDGRWITSSQETMPSKVTPSTELMPTVKISFDPDNAERHEVTEHFSVQTYVWFVVSHLVITAFGLWGLIKNFGGRSGGERPRLSSETPVVDPVLPPVRPVVRAPRTSFGRRGL